MSQALNVYYLCPHLCICPSIMSLYKILHRQPYFQFLWGKKFFPNYIISLQDDLNSHHKETFTFAKNIMWKCSDKNIEAHGSVLTQRLKTSWKLKAESICFGCCLYWVAMQTWQSFQAHENNSSHQSPMNAHDLTKTVTARMKMSTFPTGSPAKIHKPDHRLFPWRLMFPHLMHALLERAIHFIGGGTFFSIHRSHRGEQLYRLRLAWTRFPASHACSWVYNETGPWKRRHQLEHIDHRPKLVWVSQRPYKKGQFLFLLCDVARTIVLF